ncbi:Spy/CpxP family protein refolding chaperone [Rhodocyclus tenuis]|uniref:Spy/CpxP family protein refolding chaperone n=1 Tax=Rhodocyclus tenuis TaxID=1066 RepID=A0A840GAM6_RHOTE|nr:Spy/CpxP family protein refolding chaperone [Rhodocyclus tenuis]MBB4245692.1 Spy/CpxP family protein refolding chaperone [Rhodocyclus tenuis]
MQHYRKFVAPALLASALGVFLASPALADPGCALPDGHQAHYEGHGKDVERHHQQLHDALKLSGEQEAGWKKLIDSERPRPATAGGESREDWARLTTPERAEKMLALGKARQEHMSDYVTALKDFYATLSAEQKKTFEEMHAVQRKDMRPRPAPRNP